MTNRERFEAVYREELPKAVLKYPEDYAWPVEQAPVVADKMMRALDAGTFNKDSRAFRATCKVLGIKHTYQAIRAFVAS